VSFMSGKADQKAHALSAHASILLGPGQVTAQTLAAALKAYNDAADLFEQATREIDGNGDASAKRTLQLLTTQHRKLAKDLERKLNSAQALDQNQDRGEGSSRPPQESNVSRASVRRTQTTPAPVPRDGPTLGLGAIGRDAWPPPGVGKPLSKSVCFWPTFHSDSCIPCKRSSTICNATTIHATKRPWSASTLEPRSNGPIFPTSLVIIFIRDRDRYRRIIYQLWSYTRYDGSLF
jgi:hypothetical protein